MDHPTTIEEFQAKIESLMARQREATEVLVNAGKSVAEAGLKVERLRRDNALLSSALTAEREKVKLAYSRLGVEPEELRNEP